MILLGEKNSVFEFSKKMRLANKKKKTFLDKTINLSNVGNHSLDIWTPYNFKNHSFEIPLVVFPFC